MLMLIITIKKLKKRKKNNDKTALFNVSISMTKTASKSRLSSSYIDTTSLSSTPEQDDSEGEDPDDGSYNEEDENAKTLTKVEKSIKEW